MTTRTIVLTLALAGAGLHPAAAQVQETHLAFPARGKQVNLTIYRPAGTPKGTIIMGSGDVGWVGLAVDLSKFLAPEGYVVVGLNVRQYLSAFTGAGTHLTPAQAQQDFHDMAAFLEARSLLPSPVIVAGVSEGAALAVLAAAAPANHDWINGVLTMGLPAEAEIAWRWSDFTSWLTKSNAREPSFAPGDYIADVSPLPLWMIQSTKDEYVPKADYEMFRAKAKEPSRLILIDAANHRFTDKRSELRDQVLAGLTWMQEHQPAK
ncbi:MAG: alpha/beta hydrolase [Acidobacteriota bacterium]|nr:alpha/beta hydrolase [Acidobacteriota bacterium]